MTLRKKTLSLLISALMVVALIAVGPVISAQSNYPSRPITWIVAWSAGGGTDTASRVFVSFLEKELGVRIDVHNITGGGGAIGYTAAKQALPNGYTMTTIQSDLPKQSAMALSDLRVSDYDIIGSWSSQSPILAVAANSPWQTLDDFIEDARKNPGKYRIGVSDLGGVHHQPVVLLEEATGIKLRAVSHEGAPQATPALLGGNLDIVSTWVKQTTPYVQEGQMRYLAYFGDRRLEEFPDVPTVKELGYDIVWHSPYGFGLPHGVSDEVKEVLAEAMQRVWENPEFLARVKDIGHVLLPLNGEEYTELLNQIETDIARVVELMAQAEN
jgi:tripartite-type tricarboxylate transporter receptor subunit TctC